MRRRALAVIAGCTAVLLLAAGGWLWVRARAPGAAPAASISTLAASAPPARLFPLPASGPGPWLLVSGAFPSPARAYAVGDAGIGPDPRNFPCPVTVGLGCAGGGFVLASADGGRTWQREYGGSAQLDGVAAWPAGGAVAYGPDALVRAAGVRSRWQPLPLPGPGEITWGSFPSPLDWWVALSNGCASSHGLLLECQDAVFATTDGGQAWRIIARTASYPRSAPGAKVLVRQSVGGRDLGGGHGWLRDANASYLTSDGGRTWTPAPEGAAGSGVAMTSPQRGFRLSELPPSGQDSTTTEVLATADGGRTWSQVGRVGQVVTGLRAGADGSLWALATQHRSVGLPGWACARTTPTCGPSVWVSADGGRVWSQHPAQNATIGWMAPLSATRAIAGALTPSGRDGLVLTTDGGRSWTPVASGGPAPGPSVRMGFWSPVAGWGTGLAGDPSATLFTADGGRTWHRAGDLPAGTYDAAFTNRMDGWANTVGPAWRVSRDGGRTWRTPSQAPPSQMLAGFNLGTFGHAGLSALMQGGPRSPMAASISQDDGGQWSPVGIPTNTVALRFASPAAGWAVRQSPPAAGSRAPAYALLQTRDGGHTWRSIANLPGSGAIPLIAAPGPSDLWAVALDRGRWILLRTADGGAHWFGDTLPPPLADPYFAGDTLSAVNAEDGWLLTHSGLWRTTDGGATWSRVAEP